MFTHPGALHTKPDLERLRLRLRDEPWKSGLQKLKEHPASSKEWRIRGGAFPTVCREAKKNLGNDELASDSNAAYQNALLWWLTGERAHKDKAIAILDAWGGSLQSITGHDKELAAALYGFKLVNAAELLGHKPFAECLRRAFIPVVTNFATFANGNWDTACIKMLLACGVFLDDKALFDKAVAYYKTGAGNGRLTHYIINEAGQCQESGRDQQHVQLGIAHLAEAAEIAWNQGMDLYSADNFRLLKGFEYTAKYNLGEDVPFERYKDKTGKYDWPTISDEGRGKLRPIYEMALNHFDGRLGKKAPYTRRAAESLRPEGAAFQADHPGFGTLLFLDAPRNGR